jgi:hypothetical protein
MGLSSISNAGVSLRDKEKAVIGTSMIANTAVFYVVYIEMVEQVF